MKSHVQQVTKYAGTLIEYLDEGKLRPALAVRESGNQLAVVDASGREKSIARDLVLIRHPERRATAENRAQALGALALERLELAKELDLKLLWEVVAEQERGFRVEELAELFFGTRSSVGAAVMLEALL